MPEARALPTPTLRYEVELLERDAEMAALDGLIAAASAGGRVLAIEGPAGIGKTRLLAEARTRALAAGMRVLAARGSELEREFSFGIARQVFEPLLTAAPEDDRAELLSGAARLAAPIVDPAQVAAGPTGDTSMAVLHGLFWLTSNAAARQPVLLAIDDLHWCDAPSLRWLAYLLPRLEGLPILIVVGLRPREPRANHRLLTQITADPLATVVRPIPLSEDAAAHVVREMLAADADAVFAAACHRESGGNPLLLRELVRAIAADRLTPTAENVPRVLELGARAVSQTVLLRLASVSADAAQLARAVATLGDGAEPDHAAALAELDANAASDAAADLTRIDILRRGTPLGFVHPVVRAAVYEELTQSERERRHARAARLLSDARAEPERVAAQLLLSAPARDAAAVTALRDAAHQALARGAADSAVAYLRRALDEPPPDDDREQLLLEFGSAELLVDGAAAAAPFEEALRLTDDPLTRANAAVMLGQSLSFSGRFEEAVAVRTRAIGDLDGAYPEIARQLEAGLLTLAILVPRLYPLAVDRFARIRAEPPEDDLGGKMLLALLAYHDARAGAPADESAARARQALAGGLLLREGRASAAFGQVYSVDDAIRLDPFASLVLASADLDEALDIFDGALAHAHEQGSVLAFAAAKALRGRTLFLRGALPEAEAELGEGLAALDSWGTAVILRAWTVAYLADALMERGKLDGAAAALEHAGLREHEPDSPHALWLLDSRARLRLVRGDVRSGLAGLLDCGSRFEAVGGRNPAFLAWRSEAALAYRRLEQPEEARRLAAEEVELARAWGAPRALGRALRVAGLVGCDDERISLLRESVAVLDGSPARLEHAKTLVELGAALRRGNHRSAAREPLRRGLELATICGATPLAEHAETELLATGARPRRIALSGVDSLTPSERRVAELAAGGGTNREIAQGLFVTPRTVEVHLTSAYRKLAIASRAQLAKALAGRDGVGPEALR